MGRPLRRVPGLGLGRPRRPRPTGARRAAPGDHARGADRPGRRSRSRRSAPAACPSSTGCSAAGWCRAPRSCSPASPASARARCCSRSPPRPPRYQRRTLYVTGEESASQVRLRADRTGGVHDELYLAAETDLGAVLTHIEQVRPDAAGRRLDPDHRRARASTGVPGGVTQVKEVAAALIRVAKTRNITIVLVGHVTKDGSIAGPRVLEHVVDVVLHFEGDRNSRFRMVRAMKNRFGPVDEVGCFDLVRRRHHRGHRPDRPVRRAPPPARCPAPASR